MFDFDLLQIVAGLPGLVIAMVVHEYAHALVAVKMGDPTPRFAGRLSLNPMNHIDPIGLLCMFLVHFGWAKPVSINPYNFRNPRMGDILVSLAGPFANFVTAFIAMAMLFALFAGTNGAMSSGAQQVFSLIILYNINFGIFNLIPVPPLDGSHVLKELLPGELAYKLAGLERYSFLILLVFLMTPLPFYILQPISRGIIGAMSAVLSFIF